MKIQIDTIGKVIRIEEIINIGELIGSLKKLFPKGEWKEYSMDTNQIINWTSPIVVEPYKSPYYPQYPWNAPMYHTIEYSDRTDGVFNFEINN